MHRYRCSRGQLGCGARFTKKLAPHQYARAVHCPSCNSIHVQSVNKEAMAQTARRKRRGLICRCNGYPFPHVRGTLRFCSLNPRCSDEPTEADMLNYQSILETPRGCAV